MGHEAKLQNVFDLLGYLGVNAQEYMGFKHPNTRLIHTGIVTPLVILHYYAEKLHTVYGSRDAIYERLKNVVDSYLTDNRLKTRLRRSLVAADNERIASGNKNNAILTIRDMYDIEGRHASHNIYGTELDFDLSGNSRRMNPIVHASITSDMLRLGRRLLSFGAEIFRVGCYIFEFTNSSYYTGNGNCADENTNNQRRRSSLIISLGRRNGM